MRVYDDPKYGARTSLLFRLCKSIFHIGMVVILNSGFCVLRAIIELKKRGVFASALIKKGGIGPSMLMEIASTCTLKIKKSATLIHFLVKWMVFHSKSME